MTQIKRKALLALIGLSACLASALALAAQGPTAACLLIDTMDLQRLPDGSLTDSTDAQEQARYIQIAQEARERISSKFGAPEAKPILVFFNDSSAMGSFHLNANGSAPFIGSRACVLIGPKGQNTDVVAHELLHSEIHHRVGYMKRWLQLPAWFDEGIAMQVDYRSRYDIAAEDIPRADAVRSLFTFSSFFSGGENTVVTNYARAKHVAGAWLAKTGGNSLYERLDRMRRGESFAEAMDE